MGLLSAVLGAGRAIGGAIGANQRKQKNKGLIAQAFRQNELRQDLAQADTRQNLTESLNARGLLSPGAQATPTYTKPAPVTGLDIFHGKRLDYGTGGTRTQQVARAGGGPGIDPYRPGASRGAVGAANTVGGAAQADLTDQFALERKDLVDQKTAQNHANEEAYKQGLISAAMSGVQVGTDIYQGMNAKVPTPPGPAIPDEAFRVTSRDPRRFPGAYGIDVNPTFPSGTPKAPNRKSIIGDGQPAFDFQVDY